MTLTTWWRGRGQHRAVDRIPVLTSERDLWFLLALWQAHQLTVTGRQLEKADAQNTLMACELDGLRIENADLLNAWEEAAARAREAAADLANLRAISAPAPADGRPAVQLADPDATVETPIPPWLAFPPNVGQAA